MRMPNLGHVGGTDNPRAGLWSGRHSSREPPPGRRRCRVGGAPKSMAHDPSGAHPPTASAGIPGSFVCVRGVPQATVRVDDGHAVSEVVVPRGCHSVYVTDGETRHVSVFEIPPRRYRVAQVYLTQLTCGRGLGRECDPHAFPVLQGPDPATNPASGFVGGTGPQGHPSLKGLSGFVVEYFHVRGR